MDVCGVNVPEPIGASLHEMKDIGIREVSNVGSNGYVFFGHHKILDADVAIKYYFSEHGNHDEVRYLVGINHPNVLRVMDARSVGGGWAYFMSPELQGGNLDDILARRKLSLKEGVELTKGILSGLGAIHRYDRLVHGDLKPQNILVEEDGRPIIADFGSVARIPEGAASVSPPVNTVLYRPPEAFSFAEARYTFSSDLYQVGIVMYLLVGGSLSPHMLDYLDEKQTITYNSIEDDLDRSRFFEGVIHGRARGGTLVRLSSLPAYTPDKVIKIIRKATRRAHSRRFQTASEFLVALHKLGNLPEWQLNNGNIMFLPNWDGWDYRIVSRKGNAVCEKRRIGTGRWRKDRQLDRTCKKDLMSAWWSTYY